MMSRRCRSSRRADLYSSEAALEEINRFIDEETTEDAENGDDNLKELYDIDGYERRNW